MSKIDNYLKQDSTLLVHLVVITLATSIVYFIVNHAVNRFLNRHAKKDKFDATNIKFLQRLLGALIILVGFGFFIFLIPSLRHIATTLLAGAGVIVAVIGFSSQQVLSNMFSGIMIVVTKPYRLKDTVTVRDTTGIVEDITLRHTVIRNYENKRVIIPNSVMNSEIIVNANLVEDVCCEFIEITISYSSDIKRAKAMLKEEIIKHPLLIDHRTKRQKDLNDEILLVRVISLGDFAITLRAWAWAANSEDAFILKCDLIEQIKERFEKEGIEIPFPYQNVILRNIKESDQ
ncbi:MAG: mechanosensitive ion channel family protein [Candidatus Saccharimonadaceae bacterium]